MTGYAILGEVPCDGPRCFAVRLNLEGPTEVQEVRFVLYGIDPLWVVRYEDYEMIIHWECRPPGTARDSGPRPAQK